MSVAAGSLNRRITIERATEVRGAEFGGVVQTWAALATVWADVKPVSDGERWRAGEMAAHVTHRFVIRWGVSPTPKDRIVFDGRVFEISGVKEVGFHEGWEITAAARAE